MSECMYCLGDGRDPAFNGAMECPYCDGAGLREEHHERDDDDDHCCLYPADGHYHCSAIGSEDCDWCPNYGLIGKPIDTQPSEPEV